jgi:hypothetical protein
MERVGEFDHLIARLVAIERAQARADEAAAPDPAREPALERSRLSQRAHNANAKAAHAPPISGVLCV